MSSRLVAVLVVLSVSLTAIAAALILAGPTFALYLAALTAVSVAGWLWSRSVTPETNLVSPYLAILPLALLLYSLRYADDWVPVFGAGAASAFQAGYQLTDVAWFVAFVCLPVSAAALGGFFLTRRQALGGLMAWWTAFWAISEGILQIAFAGRVGWSVLGIAALVVAVALIGAGILLLQRLLAPKAAEMPIPAPLTGRQRTLWAVLFLSLAAVYGVTLYLQAGFLPVGIILGSMMGGMVGWWHTTSRQTADPARIVPLYLLMMALFYIHVGEETVTGFAEAIAGLTGTPWPEHEFILLINLGGPVVWFFAAWSIWKRQAIGNYILWFMIVGMILGEPAHLLVFPVVTMIRTGGSYGYFSGMYTALFAMIPAILMLVEIVRETRARA